MTNNRIAAARSQFPGAEKYVYLEGPARGLLPRAVVETVNRYLEDRMMAEADKGYMFDSVESARTKYASLINAHPDEVTFARNVSDGLNIMAAALPMAPGDNVILCRDLEHPANVYPWLLREKLNGIEVRMVPSPDGHMPVQAMIDAIDERTKAVTVSTVTFAPGFRTDLETLGKACREKGVFLLLDGAQSIGLLHMDVERLNVDAIAVGGQKGLLGFYGFGFLYCRREWAERMEPPYLARYSVDLGDAHEADMGEDDYKLMPGARRFDGGNYNYIGAIAADKALDLLLDLGTENIEAHICALARRLGEGLHDLGFPVCGWPVGPHWSSTITAGHFNSRVSEYDDVDGSFVDGLSKHLSDNGVKLSVRRGMLRFGFHLYNNAEDVDKVLALTKDWQRKAA
ncbi:MAG: aminotransferase class V-fold PLP-dependent enzyme [Rhodospirillales bacterium]